LPNLPEPVVYITLDTETSDWTDDKNADRQSLTHNRMVQVAWVEYDKNGQVIGEFCYKVITVGFVVSEKKQHFITSFRKKRLQ